MLGEKTNAAMDISLQALAGAVSGGPHWHCCLPL